VSPPTELDKKEIGIFRAYHYALTHSVTEVIPPRVGNNADGVGRYAWSPEYRPTLTSGTRPK